MKLGIITDRVYPFYTGGYEYLIYNLATKFSRDWDVTVYSSMDDSEAEIGGAKFKKISNCYRYTNSKGNHNVYGAVRFLLNLRKNIETFNENDIIIMNSIPYLGYGNILRKLKVRRISLFHEAWFDYLTEMNFISRTAIHHEISKIVNNSNLLIAVSHATEDSLLHNYKAKNVSRIPIGIETKSIDCTPKEKKLDIVYIGRLAKIKHVDHIISAAKMLVSYLPDIRIGIAGDGEDQEMIEAMVKGLNLSKNISLYGRVNETEKYELLKSGKIFVLPSEREGFSISTLEAMCCGAVPIVAEPHYKEVFGSSDFVKNEMTGLYYRYGNIVELMDKIKTLMKDNDLYNKLRMNAINTAKQYDWNIVIKMYENAINSLLVS
ncbi:MAG: glycosyltransferase family 4 protein [Thermoplasmatales archaeon]|nr:glycosyltransferase family 4 protein [Thermoplasmatales archaeon]